jgi:pimeloyl-ACP methyl ester carboxylesterase
MKNISDTEAYTLFDHVFSKTVRSLSHVVGLKKITQPFWNRWLASGVDEAIIFRFLDSVGTIDGWADTAKSVVRDEITAFETRRTGLTNEQEIRQLRDLSYVCNMAQWGCLPLTDDRRALYAKCRDYYIEAETMAFPQSYRRIEIAFQGKTLHGNLHIKDGGTAPLTVIIHGIDGCKEEHLATELALLDAGFSTLCFDGPGQAESLLLNGTLWNGEFYNSISAAIDRVGELHGADVSRTGVLGISIGGMWALRAAADDSRIKAVFDLGGPIHTRAFPKLPFLIKTRMCQVTGAREGTAISAILGHNNIEDDSTLSRITASVRMLHGSRDRVVAVADKEWLLQRLQGFERDRQLSLRVIEGGDHCCTGHFDAVRGDLVQFFKQELLPRG